MSVLSTTTPSETTSFAKDQEAWYDGNRVFIVMEVSRRLKPNEPSYKVRKGLTTFTVSHSELSLTKY